MHMLQIVKINMIIDLLIQGEITDAQSNHCLSVMNVGKQDFQGKTLETSDDLATACSKVFMRRCFYGQMEELLD